MPPGDRAALLRTIGRWSLAALVLNSIIGSGIFALPGTVAARLGPPSLVAWVLAALVIGVIMACFGEVASRFSGAGGPYLYAQAAFGRFIGLQMAWMAYLVRLTAAATNVNVFNAYLAEFWAPAGGRAGAAVVATLLLGVLAVVNYRGVSGGTKVSNVFAVAKTLPLLLFVALGVGFAIRHGGLAAPSVPNPTAGGWLQVLLLLMFAYGGFEAALIPLAEAREPRRDAPFALMVALGVCTALFTSVQLGVLAFLGDPGGSDRPLSEAARVLLGGAGAGFMALAAMVSVYGYLASAMLNVPRLTYAMAEQGDLPRPLGAVHSVFRTPYVSIILFGILVWGLAVQGSLLQNLSLSAVSRLSTYGLVCAALPVLRRRDGKPGAAPPALVRIPGGTVLGVIGILSATVLATRMSGREALLLAVVVIIASAHWALARRAEPRTP
jgi:amino acid transporter